MQKDIYNIMYLASDPASLSYKCLQDYLLYVSYPMDLGTVQQKLLSGEYDAPKELISDIELIFRNAKAYNAKNSEVSSEIHGHAHCNCSLHHVHQCCPQSDLKAY